MRTDHSDDGGSTNLWNVGLRLRLHGATSFKDVMLTLAAAITSDLKDQVWRGHRVYPIRWEEPLGPLLSTNTMPTMLWKLFLSLRAFQAPLA
jgi:hypothetical protein